MKNLLLVGIGGAFGSMIRYLVDSISSNYNHLPYATLFVNVTGSLMIGMLFASFQSQILDKKLQLFLIVGFCGGFTTFSTFSLENLKLLQEDKILLFLIYTLVSIGLGILAVYLGYKLAKVWI